MAVTCRNVFNSQFAVECNDLVTFLRVLFCVYVCGGRHTGIKPAILEQLCCRKADSEFWQQYLSAAQMAIRCIGFMHFKAQTQEHREKVKKVSGISCPIAGVCDFVIEIIKQAVCSLERFTLWGIPQRMPFCQKQSLGAHLLQKTMSEVREPCFLHTCSTD